ncbi:MAG: hypothetical protein U0N62_06980 [Hydrogeniiclostridium sp.]|nr:hypothetical protein [Bacillota bacterium]
MLIGTNEPAVLTVRQTLTAEQYARGARLLEEELSLTGKPGVRAAACAAGAALSASTAPLSLREYGTMWIPLLFMTAFAALGCWMYFVQPRRRSAEREREFRGAPVLGLETEIAFYRDFVLLRSEYEEVQAYWTEFSACLETGELVAAAGSGARRLLLVGKSGLSDEEQQTLSVFLENTFASNYRRIGRKGGKAHG